MPIWQKVHERPLLRYILLKNLLKYYRCPMEKVADSLITCASRQISPGRYYCARRPDFFSCCKKNKQKIRIPSCTHIEDSCAGIRMQVSWANPPFWHFFSMKWNRQRRCNGRISSYITYLQLYKVYQPYIYSLPHVALFSSTRFFTHWKQLSSGLPIKNPLTPRSVTRAERMANHLSSTTLWI